MDNKQSFLHEQFLSLDQQQDTLELGIWVFLASEVLFFGALFLSLTIYRSLFKDVFTDASRHLDLFIATVNTAVLLTSSYTMALAIQSVRQEKSKSTFRFLALTASLGTLFLALKAFEYHEDFAKNLVPSVHFSLPHHAKLFFFLYFFMTGLHALHLLIGICLVVFMALKYRGRGYGKTYVGPIEVVGLYWHFVDIVWIFLFPMFYLAGRNS